MQRIEKIIYTKQKTKNKKEITKKISDNQTVTAGEAAWCCDLQTEYLVNESRLGLWDQDQDTPTE